MRMTKTCFKQKNVQLRFHLVCLKYDKSIEYYPIEQFTTQHNIYIVNMVTVWHFLLFREPFVCVFECYFSNYYPYSFSYIIIIIIIIIQVHKSRIYISFSLYIFGHCCCSFHFCHCDFQN